MTALVTKHLPFIAGAPNGIDSLRGLILKLAIQGRLIKRELNAPSWRRLKLPEVAAYRIGKTPPSKEARHWDDKGIPWVSISDIKHFTVLTGTSRSVSREMVPETFKYPPVPAGSLLMSFKLTVGKICVLGVDAYHNEAIISLQPKEGVLRDYLMRVLPSIAKSGNTKDALMGATLNSASLAELTIPVPPPEEQASIVAKVDELMALCDRLEADQADAEGAHAQLVQALLDSLTQATDAADFRANWQRLSEHFHTLFTTEASIDLLRSAVVELALRGRLCQDDTDNSSSNGSPPVDLERLFPLPNSWKWIRLGELSPDFQNGASSRGDAIGKSVVVIRLADITQGKIDLREPRTLQLGESTISKHKISQGDFLVIRVNGSAELVGRFIVCDEDIHAIACDHFIRMRLPKHSVVPAYLKIVGGSKGVRSAIGDLFVSTAGQKTVNQGHISSLWIPLPPLATQHRIVARVDELMVLCDQLQAGLAESRQIHSQLAAALVEQAVA